MGCRWEADGFGSEGSYHLRILIGCDRIMIGSRHWCDLAGVRTVCDTKRVLSHTNLQPQYLNR